MALTLNGTTEWPSGKDLMRFGESRSLGSPRELRAIFERVADALSQTRPAVEAYCKAHPEFESIGERMLQEWEKGMQSVRQPGREV